MATFAVILPAAGKSSRFHDQHYKKPFVPLAGRPVFMYTAERFVNRDDVKQVLLAIAPDDKEYVQTKFAGNIAILGMQTVEGGARRSDTVRNALARVRDDVDFVCIHDAARPCLAEAWIDRVFAAAEKDGAAILALPITSTVKRVGPNNTIEETIDRTGLWEAQTPQVFRRQLLLDAYAKHGDEDATDEAMLVERLGQSVTVVPGSPINIKITTKEDLRLAEKALAALPKPKLPGFTHPFADDDKWR